MFAAAASQATESTAGFVFGFPARLYHLSAQSQRNTASLQTLRELCTEAEIWVNQTESELTASNQDPHILDPVRRALETAQDYIQRSGQPGFEKWLSMTFRVDHTAGRMRDVHGQLASEIRKALLLVLNRIQLLQSTDITEIGDKIGQIEASMTNLNDSLSSVIAAMDRLPAEGEAMAANTVREISDEIQTLIGTMTPHLSSFVDRFEVISQSLQQLHTTTTEIHDRLRTMQQLDQERHEELLTQIAETQALFEQQQAGVQQIIRDQNYWNRASAYDGPPGRFVERQREITALKRKFSTKARVDTLVGITGSVGMSGGVGKSTLAARLAQQRSADLRYDFIYQLGMADHQKESSWRMLARKLAVSIDEGMTLQDVARKIFDTLGENMHYLLLLDNLEMSYEELRQLLGTDPRTNRHVLCTLRQPQGWPENNLVRIGAFSESDALSYIHQHYDGTRDRYGEYEEDVARELAQRLGYLPLALELAMGRIFHPSSPTTMRALSDELKAQGLAALETATTDGEEEDEEEEEGFGEEKRGVTTPTYPEALILALWNLFAEEPRMDPLNATGLLGYISLLGADRIPYNVLLRMCGKLHPENGDNSNLLNRLLDELVSRNLISRPVNNDGDGENPISIHRLLQDVVRTNLVGTDQPYDDSADQQQVTAGWTNWFVPLSQALETCCPHKAVTAEDYNLMGQLTGHMYELRALDTHFSGAGQVEMDPRMTPLGDDDPLCEYRIAQAKLYYKLGRCWREQFNFPEATETFGTALERLENIVTTAKDHPFVRLNLMGSQDAEVTDEVFLAHLRTISPEQLQLRANIRFQLAQTQSYDMAEGLNEHAERGYRYAEQLYQLLIDDHPGWDADNPKLATFNRNNLGWARLRLGQLDEAIEAYEASLGICKAHAGDPALHGTKLHALAGLATAYTDKCEWETARGYFADALAMARDGYGARSKYHADILKRYGDFHHQRGNYLAAIKQYDMAISIEKELRGDTHPRVALSLRTLGKIASDYAALPNLGSEEKVTLRRQAIHSYRHALDILEGSFTEHGEDHPEITRTRIELAKLHLQIGEFSAANSYCRATLAGPENPIRESRATEEQFSAEMIYLLLLETTVAQATSPANADGSMTLAARECCTSLLQKLETTSNLTEIPDADRADALRNINRLIELLDRWPGEGGVIDRTAHFFNLRASTFQGERNLAYELRRSLTPPSQCLML